MAAVMPLRCEWLRWGDGLGWRMRRPYGYYPKDAWVRLRPVANPGYRFMNWETAALIFKAIGVGADRRIWRGSAF